MSRRFLYLNGLAILTVVVGHAAAYGWQAMFLWTDRYRDVAVPNFDQLDTLPYFVTMAIRQLVVFAVPAFYFVSGYFIAFLAKGLNTRLTWAMVAPRIKVLLIPFVIWTVFRFVLLMRLPTSLNEVLMPYHFIPVLIQFFLLAPFIVPMAKRRWGLLLLWAALIQVGIIALRYCEFLFSVALPNGVQLSSFLPGWLFLAWPFYFPLGAVAGFHLEKFKVQLLRLRWGLLAGTVLLASLAIAEYHFVDRLNGNEWIGPHSPGLARPLFVLAFLLTFLAFHQVPLPFSRIFTHLGAKSLGIYLGNIPAIYVIAVMMYFLTPWALGNQLIYQSVLLLVGVGGPLLFMQLVKTSPARPVYRYLFG